MTSVLPCGGVDNGGGHARERAGGLQHFSVPFNVAAHLKLL